MLKISIDISQHGIQKQKEKSRHQNRSQTKNPVRQMTDNGTGKDIDNTSPITDENNKSDMEMKLGQQNNDISTLCKV